MMKDWDAKRTDVELKDFLDDLARELPPRISQRVLDARAVIIANDKERN